MSLLDLVPPTWRSRLAPALAEASPLESFLAAERASATVFPAPEETFRALELTAPDDVAVVILGQDPYPTPGHAHGLAFSVQPGVKPPKSLANIYRELESDLGIPPSPSGFLEPWARQGVLLLNTILTVRAGEAGSHRKKGWEPVTDAILRALPPDAVFLLWGKPAQEKLPLVPPGALVLAAPHPSPLSAYQGFFGCRHFSQANSALRARGRAEIRWDLGP